MTVPTIIYLHTKTPTNKKEEEGYDLFDSDRMSKFFQKGNECNLKKKQVSNFFSNTNEKNMFKDRAILKNAATLQT